MAPRRESLPATGMADRRMALEGLDPGVHELAHRHKRRPGVSGQVAA